MGLGNKSNSRVLLGISHGKITHKIGENETETFDFIEGRLLSVARRMADVKGLPTEFLDLTIEDGGIEYCLSTQLSGSIARGLILSLASVQDFHGNRVRISAFLSKDGGHTNTSVALNGKKMAWVTSKLPTVKETNFGGRVLKDDSERVTFVTGFVDVIKRKLDEVAATSQVMSSDDFAEFGDMPCDEE